MLAPLLHATDFQAKWPFSRNAVPIPFNLLK